MTQELTPITSKGKSIIMRNGVEILLDDSKAEAVESVLLHMREHKFIKIGSRVINTADLVGIFELEDYKKH